MAQLTHLGPELILTAVAVLILIVDLISEEDGRNWSPWLALIGFVLTALWSVSLFYAPTPETTNPILGSMYVSDSFTSFFRFAMSLLGALIVLASKDYVEQRTKYVAEFYALLMFVVLSAVLLAGSIDLVMLFLSFEFLSITSYIMVGYLRDDKKSSEGALKYFLYGSVSSAIMLYGISLLYGAGGYTNLEEMASFLASKAALPYQGLVIMGMILTVVGFGFKIALAPFHQWSPDAYEGAPTPVTAFISVGPKIAGFAALARVVVVGLTWQFKEGQPYFVPDWSNLLWAIAAISMTLGNLVALRQRNIKRLIAYSSIAQTGYMLIGIVANVASGDGVRGILVYLVAYIFTNIGLFIAVIAYSNQIGSDEIEDYAGMIQRSPFMAIAMLIFFLSLAGIPPTAGFVGKFLVFGAAIDAANATDSQMLTWLAVIGAVNSVISIGYYFNIVRYMFFVPPKETTTITLSPTLNFSLVFTTAMTLVMGVLPQPFIDFAALSVKAIFKS
jgi:proton-translocating NADH-quinone oxidoreductase chain N